MSENLIPAGRYTAVLTKVAGEDGDPNVRFSYSSKDTKQVLVYFEVLDGQWAGTVVPWFGFFTEKTWKRTVESLKYCGLRGDNLAAVNDQDLDQKVQIVVEHNEWENDEGELKTNARVAWVNRLNAGAIKLKKPMGQDELRQFAAQMKSRLSTVKDEVGERHVPTNGASEKPSGFEHGAPPYGREENAPPPVEDDIPF